jgi:hypothetical protein
MNFIVTIFLAARIRLGPMQKRFIVSATGYYLYTE